MSTDLGEQIILAIFERTPIWNGKEINHKNRKIINQLWEEIKNELNIEVTDLKKKCKNIKDRYRKELKKIPAPRSGDAGSLNQPSNWQYYSQLSFLRDEMIPNITEGNLSSFERTNDHDEINIVENSQEFTTGRDEEASTSTQEASITSQEEASTSSPASTSRQPKKKKTANDIRNEFLELEKKKIRLLENDLSNQSRNEASMNKSDDYYFLMSLLPQMEMFTPVQRFRVRQKFNQAILEELNGSESMNPSNE